MALKTQTTQMRTAYGQRFSQQDLTTREENVVNQPLKTPQYKEGGMPLVVALARDRNVQFAGGGTSKGAPRKENKV